MLSRGADEHSEAGVPRHQALPRHLAGRWHLLALSLDGVSPAQQHKA